MILLLAGTKEARNLAGYLAQAGIDCIASLAGVTQSPYEYPLETRSGGFGGEEGFLSFLAAKKISAVIDATHPFATQITERTARLCAERAIPYLRYERPEWRSRHGDAWHEVASIEDLAAIIPVGARAFVATGKQTLDAYALLGDRTLFCRVIDPPSEPFPYPQGGYIVARPPFTEASERALFEEVKPDWLVVKNAGGASGRAKLDAARALGISVAMIARPAPLDGIERREQVLDALEWAEAL
ncbi:cobalt-precorrin-6A reductase [Celeribacter arenosi]|uniref:Cobalt-precorrin-6A reductase n=1 Tax=Celeribacter arenosi TaxID=792649 RepID=A0ABP7KFM4_9RHOB